MNSCHPPCSTKTEEDSLWRVAASRRRSVLRYILACSTLFARPMRANTSRNSMDLEARAPSVSLTDYRALRAYSGNASRITISGERTGDGGDGIAGIFARDHGDVSSPDNSGTIIVDDQGSRWKRIYVGEVNVRWFGAKGDGKTDDTAAFKQCISAARKIYLPPGTYLTNFGESAYNPAYITHLPSGTSFRGAGSRTIWKPQNPNSRGCVGTDSAGPGAWSEDIAFSEIHFEGDVLDHGLDERAHLLYLSGVRRVRVENCTFRGMRGDGLYIGSGFGGGPNYERHNFDVRVRHCEFDGLNNENRNGVSVIDVDGMLIEGCAFVRNSAKTMPGSVDFEPDESYSVIRNVTITANKFEQCSGKAGHILFDCGHVPNSHFTNVTIEGNEFHGNNGVLLNMSTIKSAAHAALVASPNNVVVSRNRFIDVLAAFYKGPGLARGVSFTDNSIISSLPGGGRILIGKQGPTASGSTTALKIVHNRISGNSETLIEFTDDLADTTVSENVLGGATLAALRISVQSCGANAPRIRGNRILGSPAHKVLYRLRGGSQTYCSTV
jgi:hypothetical protein